VKKENKLRESEEMKQDSKRGLVHLSGPNSCYSVTIHFIFVKKFLQHIQRKITQLSLPITDCFTDTSNSHVKHCHPNNNTFSHVKKNGNFAFQKKIKIWHYQGKPKKHETSHLREKPTPKCISPKKR
jgi:hypothetical protein